MSQKTLEYDPVVISDNHLIDIITEKNIEYLKKYDGLIRESPQILDQKSIAFFQKSSDYDNILICDLHDGKIVHEDKIVVGRAERMTYLPKEQNIQLTDYEGIDMYYGFKLPIKYLLLSMVYRPDISNFVDKVNKTIYLLYRYSSKDRKIERTDFRVEKNYDLDQDRKFDPLTIRDKYILIDNGSNSELYDIETGTFRTIETGISNVNPHNSPDGHIIFVGDNGTATLKARKIEIAVWDMDKMEFKFRTSINLTRIDYHFFIKDIKSLEGGYRMFFMRGKSAFIQDINSKQNQESRIIWDDDKLKASIVKDRVRHSRLTLRNDIQNVQYLGSSKVLVTILDRSKMVDSEDDENESEGDDDERRRPKERVFILDIITGISEELNLLKDYYHIFLVNSNLCIVDSKYVIDLKNNKIIKEMEINEVFPFILDYQKKNLSNLFLSSFKSNIIPLDIKKIIISLI